MTSDATTQTTQITEAEYEAMVNAKTQRLLGMTADEFRSHAANQTLPDHPAVAHLLLLANVESHGACSL